MRLANLIKDLLHKHFALKRQDKVHSLSERTINYQFKIPCSKSYASSSRQRIEWILAKFSCRVVSRQ